MLSSVIIVFNPDASRFDPDAPDINDRKTVGKQIKDIRGKLYFESGYEGPS